MENFRPKLESFDFTSSSSSSNPTTPFLPKTLTLKPHFPPLSPLDSLPPNIADENRRITRLLSSLPNRNPNPNPNPNPSSIAKKRTRPTELLRVSGIAAADEAAIRADVRRTQILYESLRTRLIQEEEGKYHVPGRRSRTDLTAASLMRDRGLWLNRDVRTVGFIPGVHVGDVYFYRMELMVLGIHGQTQAGIDFLTASCSPNDDPIATNIIISNNYKDDEDSGDVLVYTGHGGRGGKGRMRRSTVSVRSL